MTEDSPAPPDPALVKALAAQLYGVVLDDARAARIAADLAALGPSRASAGAIPPSAAPGADFRQILLASGLTPTSRA